jgi:predicted nucleotidyltransferase
MDLPFDALVRSRRALLGLTQRALAERSGVQQSLISAIESGRRAPTPASRAALELALAVRPSLALERRRAEVMAAVRRHGGLDAAVFGSVAHRTDDADSDLDLMVSFAEGRDIVDLLSLQAELERLLTVPVDVVSAGSTGAVAARARRESVALRRGERSSEPPCGSMISPSSPPRLRTSWPEVASRT